MKFLSQISCVLLLTSCSQWASRSLPPCFNPVDTTGFTEAHFKALENSKKLNAKPCSKKQFQCNFTVLPNDRNELLVNTGYFFQDRKTGQCIQVVAGNQLDIYDAYGNFKESNPGF